METPPPEKKLPWEQVFNFVVIGDVAVGKTCLLLQFTDHKFLPLHDPTIGVEMSSRIITINDTPTKVRVFDMSGRESFRSLTRSFCQRAAAAILVYDVTRRETFDHVGTWLRDATKAAPANLTVILVGNKCDLDRERAVGFEEGRAFAEEHGLVFVEASAKTKRNVEEAFFTAARIVSQKLEDGVIDASAKFGGNKFGITFCRRPTLERRSRWWWWWLCCR